MSLQQEWCSKHEESAHLTENGTLSCGCIPIGLAVEVDTPVPEEVSNGSQDEHETALRGRRVQRQSEAADPGQETEADLVQVLLLGRSEMVDLATEPGEGKFLVVPLPGGAGLSVENAPITTFTITQKMGRVLVSGDDPFLLEHEPDTAAIAAVDTEEDVYSWTISGGAIIEGTVVWKEDHDHRGLANVFFGDLTDPGTPPDDGDPGPGGDSEMDG